MALVPMIGTRPLSAFLRGLQGFLAGQASTQVQRRLQRSTLAIVKGAMKEEQVFYAQADGVELAAKLVESVRPQAPADQGAYVLGAEIHGHGGSAVEREALETDRAHLVADHTAPFLGAFDERWSLAQGEQFLAVGAIRFARDSVPAAFGP
jgi:hypothetical protein